MLVPVEYDRARGKTRVRQGFHYAVGVYTPNLFEKNVKPLIRYAKIQTECKQIKRAFGVCERRTAIVLIWLAPYTVKNYRSFQFASH